MKPDFDKLTKNFKTKNALEKTGVKRDLEIISEKLKKGEYQKGFIVANKFDIPLRTEALFREMEFLLQLGQDWARILKYLPFNKFKKIADICPGYTPKIELALFFNNYKGEINILDLDKKSLDSLERFIKLFSPKFRIVKVLQNLFFKKLPQYDLVLGNHIIDDLVVYYFCQDQKIKLKDFYSNEQVAEKVWQNILKNKANNLDEIAFKIAGILDNLVNSGGYICLSQYKSYSEKLFSMDEAYEFNKFVFKQIKEILEGGNFVKDKAILNKAFKGYSGHFGKKDCVIFRKK